MKLIDADALIKFFKENSNGDYTEWFLENIEDAIKDAPAESDKRTAELKDEINDLNKEQVKLNKWLDSNRVWFENSNKEIAELRAYINVLRDALMDIAKTNASTHGTTRMMLIHCIKTSNEAIASTPAQSLQAHDDEVIERCAKIFETEYTDFPESYMIQSAKAVRELKENQFPNSANLDVYNSVVFSDGSHGTMIMESKIVKWLCRNRAKDYFDEMVEGK